MQVTNELIPHIQCKVPSDYRGTYLVNWLGEIASPVFDDYVQLCQWADTQGIYRVEGKFLLDPTP